MWRVSKYSRQYSYMNFISGNRMRPPVARNRGSIANAEISAILPVFDRTWPRLKTDCSGKPNTPSRIIEIVPITWPSHLAHSVVVVGRAW